jgi:integrase
MGGEMRAVARVQGRFVSVWNLKKIPGPPGGAYEYIIVDSTGRPLSHLTEWYRLRKHPGALGTRRTYLHFLLPFMGYLHSRGIAWNLEPDALRTQVKAFLSEEVACFVTRDQDVDGYHVQLTSNSPLSQSSLRVFFAALRDFYLVMHEAGLYAYENPMRSELFSKWKRERMRHIAHAGAPDHAGIRSEERENTWLRPTAFFRLKRKLPWRPGLALEPTAVLRRIKQTIESMIASVPTQRDRLVLLLLYHTGARISEILGLTAGGYRKARHATRAFVTNKGSMGREEKLIYFTPEIERALVQYIRTERARHDPLQRTRLEQLADHEPIFLTQRGTAYTRSSWYYHWDRWLAAIAPDEYTSALGQVLFSPHDIRHLYVSWLLRHMKERYAHDAAKLATLREALQQRMAWRSPLTIACYDQSESERERLEQFDHFLYEVEQQTERETAPAVVPAGGIDGSGSSPAPDDGVRQATCHTTKITTRTALLLQEPPERTIDDLAFWEERT